MKRTLITVSSMPASLLAAPTGVFDGMESQQGARARFGRFATLLVIFGAWFDDTVWLGQWIHRITGNPSGRYRVGTTVPFKD